MRKDWISFALLCLLGVLAAAAALEPPGGDPAGAAGGPTGEVGRAAAGAAPGAKRAKVGEPEKLGPGDLVPWLTRTAEEWSAPEGPLPGALGERPLKIVVEADHVAQIRRTGSVGMAVSGAGPSGSAADLHLVYHPDDLFAYRHAVAEILLRRSGLADGLSPLLRQGAALLLSRDWYGRPYEEWLPPLAAGDAFPEAAELAAAEPAADSSGVLWPPVAAAVIADLPGESLAEKLAALPAAEKSGALAEALRRVAARARRAAGGPVPPEPPSPPPLSVADGGPGGALGLTQRGVSFAMLNDVDRGYHAPVVARDLAELEGLGVNAVSVMPFAYQRAPNRPELRYLNRRPASETDVGTLHAARRARERGMTVLWKPHIWLHDSWPGEIAMGSEADWELWWRSYRRFVLHHAVLARHARAEIFSIGVELTRTLGRTDDWNRLIDGVRRIYPGRLTYSANWYGGVEAASFWKRLDYVGVDAYYPLADSPEASDEELAAGARRAVETMAAAARKAGRPVLLTEVGFAARRAAWADPHEEGGALHEGDQARAYRALFSALEGRPWLRGAYVWKSFSGGPRGDRPDFQFLGRPAEEEIARFYRSAAVAAR